MNKPIYTTIFDDDGFREQTTAESIVQKMNGAIQIGNVIYLIKIDRIIREFNHYEAVVSKIKPVYYPSEELAKEALLARFQFDSQNSTPIYNLSDSITGRYGFVEGYVTDEELENIRLLLLENLIDYGRITHVENEGQREKETLETTYKPKHKSIYGYKI